MSIHEQNPIFSSHQIRVPPELPSIMKEYTKHIIRTKPTDIYAASAEYFKELVEKTDGSVPPVNDMAALKLFYQKLANVKSLKMSELKQEAHSVGIQSSTIEDVFQMLNVSNNEQSVDVTEFWVFAVSHSAPTFYETLNNVAELAAEQGVIVSQILIDAATFIAKKDASQTSIAEGYISKLATFG